MDIEADSVQRKRKFAVAAVGMCISLYVKSRKKKNRSKWMKSWIRERDSFSHMRLIQHLRENEPDDYKNYLRMDQSDYDMLLGIVASKLKKEDTVMRQSIPPEERLIATLRFLATGRSFEDLKFTTGIAAQTLGRIIPETCEVMYELLKDEYMKMPNTEEEWKEVALGFKNHWQIINCGGSIDGKHIRITKPPGSGALYYNYKKFYSVVLLAIVNSKHEFIYVDIGKQGRMSDGGVIESSTFHTRLQNGGLCLPANKETDEGLNFIFVADEAFALHKHILKPYPQQKLTHEKRVFNYRLSRARNVVENTFGLMCSRFRVLHTTINMQPQKVNKITLAVCVLHNFLMRRSYKYFTPSTVDRENPETHETELGLWRNDSLNCNMVPLQHTSVRNTLLEAKQNREEYLHFFNNKGRVSWQDEMIKTGKA